MAEWTWPDPPKTPRDILAAYWRNWGRDRAYSVADEMLIELAVGGFAVLPMGNSDG